MLRDGSGLAASDALVTTIHRVTEGNPFFIQEVAELLRVDGAARPDGMSAGRRFRSRRASARRCGAGRLPCPRRRVGFSPSPPRSAGSSTSLANCWRT
jgi:hypothetical protein